MSGVPVGGQKQLIAPMGKQKNKYTNPWGEKKQMSPSSNQNDAPTIKLSRLCAD